MVGVAVEPQALVSTVIINRIGRVKCIGLMLMNLTIGVTAALCDNYIIPYNDLP